MSELHTKLGELLAIERKRQNRTMDELAASLKISEGNLKLLEAGDPSGLPSPLYFELFAKSYAEELGIDYDATAMAIKDEIGCFPEDTSDGKGRTETPTKPAPEEAASVTPDHGSAFKKIAYLIGGVVALLVIFLLVNWLYLSDRGASILPGGAEVDRSSGTADLSEQPEPDADLATYDWNTPAYQEPEDISLVVTAHRESWVAVVSDGDTAFYRTLRVGQVRTVTAKYRMELSVGVPSGIDVELNGQPVDLRNQRGRIHQVEITQLNLPDILAGAAPNDVANSSVTLRPEEETRTSPEQTTSGRTVTEDQRSRPAEQPANESLPDTTSVIEAEDG